MIKTTAQSARALRFFVHFFDVHYRDYNVKPPNASFYRGGGHKDDKFSFLYLNMDKARKNSTPGKVAYIWRIERFQIDA